MENMTVSDLAMVVVAAGDSPTPALDDGGVRTVVTILMVGVALFICLTVCGFPLLGFGSAGPAIGSIAATWMSCIGNVAKGSIYALVQSVSMSGPSALVLLGVVAVVAAVWGAFEAIVWLVHAIDWHWLLQVVQSATDWVDLQGWWHSVSTWVVQLWESMPPLLQMWHSVTEWVAHLWNSLPSLLHVWHSATDWMVHLWDSIPSLLQLWHSATDWVFHLWDAIPAHRKWKILYT